MYSDDEYCREHFYRITYLQKWDYLVRQNAYYIWERKTRQGQASTPLENWVEAELAVAKNFRDGFGDRFLKSLRLSHVSALIGPETIT